MLISNPFTNPILKVDYNLYYAPNGDPNNNSWQWNNISYGAFPDYRSGSRNDMHSVFGDPQFLSLAVPNLWLQPTSLAVDSGANLGTAVVGAVDLAGFNHLAGAIIDLGAYQQRWISLRRREPDCRNLASCRRTDARLIMAEHEVPSAVIILPELEYLGRLLPPASPFPVVEAAVATIKLPEPPVNL